MQVKASIKNLKIAPKKVRLIANFVKGKTVQGALDQLKFLNKNSSDPVADLIRSAVANAEHNFKLDKANLMVKDCQVNLGLTLRRYMPKAHGRATLLQKKMSHVVVTLAEIVPSGEHKGVKPKKGTVASVESREDIHDAETAKEKTNKGKRASKDEAAEKGKQFTSGRKQAPRATHVAETARKTSNRKSA